MEGTLQQYDLVLLHVTKLSLREIFFWWTLERLTKIRYHWTSNIFISHMKSLAQKPGERPLTDKTFSDKVFNRKSLEMNVGGGTQFALPSFWGAIRKSCFSCRVALVQRQTYSTVHWPCSLAAVPYLRHVCICLLPTWIPWSGIRALSLRISSLSCPLSQETPLPKPNPGWSTPSLAGACSRQGGLDVDDPLFLTHPLSCLDQSLINFFFFFKSHPYIIGEI